MQPLTKRALNRLAQQRKAEIRYPLLRRDRRPGRTPSLRPPPSHLLLPSRSSHSNQIGNNLNFLSFALGLHMLLSSYLLQPPFQFFRLVILVEPIDLLLQVFSQLSSWDVQVDQHVFQRAHAFAFQLLGSEILENWANCILHEAVEEDSMVWGFGGVLGGFLRAGEGVRKERNGVLAFHCLQLGEWFIVEGSFWARSMKFGH